MAVTQFKTNDPLVIKTWARALGAETSKALALTPLMSTDGNNIIYVKNEVNGKPGDAITFGLRAQFMGGGVSEGETLEGNEEALQFLHDTIHINELRHGSRHRSTGSIDAQRTFINAREEARDALKDWYADRLSLGFFLHTCGYTAPQISFEGHTLDISHPKFYGFNQILPPSDKRIIRPEKKTKDEELTDANKHKFTLDLVDQAVEMAKTANPKIRPVRVGGESVYVLYLHPKQVTQLRTNTSEGQWLDINRAVYSTTRQRNPIYDGSLGMYNGVVLRESEHVTPGVHSSNNVQQPKVRRAVFLGAQSVVMAFGSNSSGDRFTWGEEYFDYKHELGVSAGAILGMKKSRYTSLANRQMQDFGTIVIPTYVDE